MDIKILSCWFATSFGDYSRALREALERAGHEVGIIATNCGCGDPMEVNRLFQDRRCEFFEFPHVGYYRSPSPVKYWLRTRADGVVNRQRAKRFSRYSGGAEVLHFQQVLNSFGSSVVFNWLSLPSKAARVVTVHELDLFQRDHRERNLEYNRADRIIVHTDEMREEMIALGVHGDRIDVIGHGVAVRPLPAGARTGIIFYGGHKLHTGKGLAALFKAMAEVRSRLGAATPILTIHGHYSLDTPEYGAALAAEAGVAQDVRWLNQIGLEETIAEYRRSLLCVLPYTGSFAGFPAVNAMANGVPVIATRHAGLPDHLGDAAVWVEDDDAAGLAEAIIALLADLPRRESLAAAGRARAERMYDWDVIARRTLDSYEMASRAKQARAQAAS